MFKIGTNKERKEFKHDRDNLMRMSCGANRGLVYDID